eukprot:CAMPEP_0202921868 /NCGR_PEP_ID=MMETSP1392-20130828/77624_2 /ASSEMBLY_ACC=CAM_ASM_000868 /TAXON_ID=225041 /ORGANISM="Chlamydomonas chlamydogama, Strain SAG 11-48b" /LENGTH=127 /DNA_ID=CAMNT_0049615467 /DNA_START=630 /DNA_END=1010 /DNA_ORIENTATION=-
MTSCTSSTTVQLHGARRHLGLCLKATPLNSYYLGAAAAAAPVARAPLLLPEPLSCCQGPLLLPGPSLDARALAADARAPLLLPSQISDPWVGEPWAHLRICPASVVRPHCPEAGPRSASPRCCDGDL